MLITFHTTKETSVLYTHHTLQEDVSNSKAFMTSTLCSMKKFDLKLATLGGGDVIKST